MNSLRECFLTDMRTRVSQPPEISSYTDIAQMYDDTFRPCVLNDSNSWVPGFDEWLDQWSTMMESIQSVISNHATAIPDMFRVIKQTITVEPEIHLNELLFGYLEQVQGARRRILLDDWQRVFSPLKLRRRGWTGTELHRWLRSLSLHIETLRQRERPVSFRDRLAIWLVEEECEKPYVI